MSPLVLVTVSAGASAPSFRYRRARATKADELYFLFRSITRATIGRVYRALAHQFKHWNGCIKDRRVRLSAAWPHARVGRYEQSRL